MIKVYIIESERGWGQRIDEILEFNTIDEAKEFCVDYNNKYCSVKESTPDWYMYARIENDKEFGMMR